MREDNKQVKINIPSMAFGVDVQNYGDEAHLIYMLDLDDITEVKNSDETLITKIIGAGNYKIISITEADTGKDVTLQRL